jgi:hypothetical protein
VKFLVTLSIRPDASAAEIEQQRIPSSKILWDMHLAGVIREMYARQDNAGVVFIAESPDNETLSKQLSHIPFLQSGLLVGEAIALVPFADIALAFK